MKRKTLIISAAVVTVIIVLAVINPFKTEMKYGKYTRPGFGSDAVISINEDGTYSYSPGALSSFFDQGNWQLKGNRLTMYSAGGDKWYFTVKGDTLEFVEGETEMIVKTYLEKGQIFSLKPWTLQ